MCRIGLLTEANTAYGAAATDANPTFRSLPFPLHIAKLRQVSHPAATQILPVTPSVQTRHHLTSLDLGSTTEPLSVIPLFSKIETSSMEVALSTLLQTISREHLRYICILASDVHDRVFLVQELRHHAPDTVLIALSSDLLYLHPDVNLDFRGMLVVSPYPLFAENQSWTDGERSRTRRLLFPAQTAQGVYNAAVALLDKPDLMQEYGQPFPPADPTKRDKSVRPWLSIVGSDGIWPVRILDVPDAMSMNDYLYERSPLNVRARPGPSASLDNEYPWFLAVLALVSLFSAAAVGSQFGLRGPRRPRDITRSVLTRWIASVRFSALLGDQVFRNHRFDHRVCTVTYLIVLLVILLLGATEAATVPWTFGVSLTSEARSAIVWLLGLAALVLLALARTAWAIVLLWPLLVLSVLRARRSAARNGRRLLPRSAAQLKALTAMSLIWLAVLAMTVVLCGTWLLTGSPEAAMLSLRSMDLSSGVSPLLPLLFMGAAASLWALHVLRRLRLVDGVDRAGHLFLGLNEKSFEGVGKLERDVRIAAGRPSVTLSPQLLTVTTMLLLAIWARLFLVRSTPTVEGVVYDLFFRLAFLLVYFALLMSFLRFVLLWVRLRRLLLRLSWHPTITAYHRLREEIPGKPKVGLAAATQVYTALEFSVDRASRLLALAERMSLSMRAAPSGTPKQAPSLVPPPSAQPPTATARYSPCTWPPNARSCPVTSHRRRRRSKMRSPPPPDTTGVQPFESARGRRPAWRTSHDSCRKHWNVPGASRETFVPSHHLRTARGNEATKSSGSSTGKTSLPAAWPASSVTWCRSSRT